MDDNARITELEDTVYRLNNEITFLYEQNDRLQSALAELYEMIKERHYAYNDDINTLYGELFKHTNKFHSMLIIGNKEEQKDESNIP